MKYLPATGNREIVVQNLPDEVLIYDLKTNQAFCLNETAAKVFNRCDGKTTFAELTRESGLTEDLIYLALNELKKKNLLAEDFASPFAGLSRREVIRKVGLSSVLALPVISSLIAPQASQAASGAAGPTACAQRGGTCIPAGQNICAGRANQTVTFYYYFTSPAGACRGSDTDASNPDYECRNDAPTTSLDACRVG